jgi:hypothetical protein
MPTRRFGGRRHAGIAALWGRTDPVDEVRVLKCDTYITSTVPLGELVIRSGVDPANALRPDLLQLLGDLQFKGTCDLVFGRERDSRPLLEVLGQGYHLT